MKKPIALPGGTEYICDPIKRQAPQVMELDGQATLIVHCAGMITGLCASSVTAGMTYDGQIMVCCYDAGNLGMMYTLNVEQARRFAASLTHLCDKQEASASDAANDVLQRARGI